MGKVIAIAIQKGGVGKTTTAINLSACVAEKGKKVLVIDIDPQGNTTTGFGIEKNELQNTIYELMLGEVSVKECIIPNVIENLPLSLIPSNINLAAAEIEPEPLMNIFKAMIKLQLTAENERVLGIRANSHDYDAKYNKIKEIPDFLVVTEKRS